MQRKHELARPEIGVRSSLGDATDAGVAELDWKAVIAAQGGQVELQAGRYLAAEHQHLRAVADRRCDRFHTHIGRPDGRQRLLAELHHACVRKPDRGGATAGHRR